MSDIKKVLINRSDAIGDNILTMPVIEALVQENPQVDIALCTSERCIDLYLEHPHISKIYTVHKNKFFLSRLSQYIRMFREFQPDHYLYVGGEHLLSFVAWLLRVPSRGGLLSRWPSFLFLNKGTRQRRSVVAMHEAEYNLELLRAFGIDYHYTQREQFAPKIFLKEDEVRSSYEDFMFELKEKGKSTDVDMIFIHPGMSGHTLNWSSRNYGRFVEHMERNYPNKYLYVISHTPSDAPFLQGLQEHFKLLEKQIPIERVHFFDGSEKGLRYYMAILSKASLFLGPSTGTTHIANTLGVPCIGLYSPIRVQSSLRWGPFHQDPKKCKIIVPDVVCGQSTKCAGTSCPYYECMSKIEVEDVLKAATELLE